MLAAGHTSCVYAGALPDHGWADVYRESGPEELSGFSSSPGWVLNHWSISLQPAATTSSIQPGSAGAALNGAPQQDAAAATATGGQPRPAAHIKLQGTLTGGPHKLLAVQPLYPSSACSSEAAGSEQQQQQAAAGWLLAVADDVDCAVLRVALNPHAATPEVSQSCMCGLPACMRTAVEMSPARPACCALLAGSGS